MLNISPSFSAAAGAKVQPTNCHFFHSTVTHTFVSKRAIAFIDMYIGYNQASLCTLESVIIFLENG